MTYSATLHPILCTTRNTEALLLAFVAAFNALIDDPSGLSAGEITDLDYYGDGVVGYDDRDYWLDWIIGRDWSPAITDRLPFADATPTAEADSDPLGLMTGQDHVVIVDPDNTIGVYVLESSTNTCWMDSGRTTTPASPSTLFTGSAGTTYIHKILRDVRSIISGDSGSANRRRFPDAAVEITVYIRGGSHTLDRECTFINQDAAGAPTPDTDPTRIVIRNYPGELVKLYAGNSTGSNAAMMTVSRPDMKIRLNEYHCYRLSGADRIFAPFLFNITNSGDRCEVSGAISECRAIAPSHPDAGTLPDYVDSAFTGRTLSAAQTTAKLLSYSAVQIGVGNVGSTLEDLTITPAGDDFPRSVTVPGGATEGDFGDTIDIAGTTTTTLRRVTIAGTSSHQAVQVRESSGTQTTGLTIEYSDIRNPENTCIGLACETSIIRYNRIHDFGSRADAQDGNGIQITHGDGNEIYGNVIWCDDDQPSGQTYGIDIGVSQSDSAMEFINSLVEENILYRCGISYGYSSSPPASDLGRVHDNSISRNIIYGLSDYSHTVPDYDGPISTNLGPHSSTMYATVFDANLIYRTDGDAAMIVERLPGSTRTDWPNVAVSPWFTNPANADPEFEAAATGDFTMRNASPGFALMDAETPLVAVDLDVDPYDCAIVPQYLPRMDVYSGRVIKNLSAVPVLLLALLTSSAGAGDNQGGCERGRDSGDAGRLGNVDGGKLFVVRPFVSHVSDDCRLVKKFSIVDVQQRKRNDGRKSRAVDEICGFRGREDYPAASGSIVEADGDCSFGRLETIAADGNKRVVCERIRDFPGDHPQRQFRLAVERHPKQNVIRRRSVNRIQGDDSDFRDRLDVVSTGAVIGNHPGRSNRSDDQRKNDDENCSFHKNQSSRLDVVVDGSPFTLAGGLE